MQRLQRAIHGDHHTKLPLRIWLLAIYFMIKSCKGVFSVFLAKWLVVDQKTAWKESGLAIQAIIATQAASLALSDGIVELDEKYLTGNPRFKQGVKHPTAKATKKACVHVAASQRALFEPP